MNKLNIKLFFITFIITFQVFSQQKSINDSLKPYVDYLKLNNFLTAKNYILNKFEKNDIVILSERVHSDITQYELILDVIKSEKFKGNIYTEVGVYNMYNKINKFLLSSNLTKQEKEKELLNIYRDIDYSVLWENYNYYYLLSKIFEINKTREKEDKVLVFPLDLKFNWDDFVCSEQYKMFDEYSEGYIIDRNVIMAKHFIKFYEYAKRRNPKREKALVIQNTYHGYIRIPRFLPRPSEPNIYSTAQYIYKTYPQYTTNIYINYLRTSDSVKLAANGLFDASFEFTKTDNVGFDLKNTPFGNTEFDLYNFGGTDYATVNYDYIFDGMVQYYPITELKFVWGIPNVYPKEYEEQFYKRLSLTDAISLEESKKKNAIYLKEINIKEESSWGIESLLSIKKQLSKWLK